MAYTLSIALRYLWSRKSHGAVNVISAVSMAAVCVAAAAMVMVLSVFNGFADLASSRLSMLDPAIRVSGKAVLPHADTLARRLERLPQVASARATLEGQGLAIYGNAQVPVTLRGIADDYGAVSGLDSTVIDGARVAGPFATINVSLAVSLDARPAYERPMIITVPRRVGRINPALPIGAFVNDTLRVSGVFSTQQADANNDVIYLPIERVRRLLDYQGGEATSIEIAPAPGVSIPEAKEAVARHLGTGYVVQDRLEQEQTSFRMIRVEKWITFVLLVFILALASFNIISTMAMLIIEKRGSISILAALGAAPRAIRRIFMAEGSLIAVAGGIAGIVIGIALALVQQWTGFIELGGDHSQMSVIAYPVRLSGWDVLTVAVVILAVGVVAGTFSSRFALKKPGDGNATA